MSDVLRHPSSSHPADVNHETCELLARTRSVRARARLDARGLCVCSCNKFLLMMLAAMRGMLSTVAVTSLSA